MIELSIYALIGVTIFNLGYQVGKQPQKTFLKKLAAVLTKGCEEG